MIRKALLLMPVALFLLAFHIPAAHAAPTDKYKIEVKDLPTTVPSNVPAAIKVTVTNANGGAVSGTSITATVVKGDASFTNKTASTGATGEAAFELVTKTDAFAEVQLTENGTPLPGAPKSVILIPSPGALKYAVSVTQRDITAGENIPDAVQITAMAGQTPVPHVKIRASIDDIGATVSDAKVYFGSNQGSSVVGETDAQGVASFGLLTNKNTKVRVRLIPLSRDEATAFAERVEIRDLDGSLFATSLGSKRSYLQLFVGQTFANSYSTEDSKGTNEHTGIGFRNGGPLIRLTFDTMWPHQLPRPKSDSETAALENSMRYGVWHTDANLEFSRFPFGSHAGAIETENEKGLKNAFSGALGVTWQPNRFASFGSRDASAIVPQDPEPYDAYRFGLFGRAGVTTRAESEPGGNSSINRIQFGFRFTHSRSHVESPLDEERNVEPIRFVEVSAARFSEWGSPPTHNDGATRVVVDAGLRIAALSNAVFPIYVGGHFNMGPGEDDMRVFLGMLVKLDLLGRLVQGTTQSPEDAIK